MGISGTCDDRFGAVRDTFAANFEPKDSIYDVGASLAVTVDGEMVVDLWGGTATFDDGAERPWGQDTIINVWSTTKTVAALACLILADRGDSTSTRPSPRSGRSSPRRARARSRCAT